MKLSRSTRWRLALGDLKAQPWRTLLAVLVLTPLAASWFLLAAVSRSLAGLVWFRMRVATAQRRT